MGQRGDGAFADELVLVIGLHALQQGGQFERTEPGIYFGYFQGQLLAIALRKASGDVQFFDFTLTFQRRVLNNGVNAFLFGHINKSAGVYHHHIGVAVAFLVGHFKIVAAQLRNQVFAVDQIFGTTQRNDLHFIFPNRLRFHACN